MRLRTAIIVFVVILLGTASWMGWMMSREEPKSVMVKPGPPVVASPKPERSDPRSVPSPLAARLNAADSTGEEDVKTLLELVRQYQHPMHGRGRPIGDDIDLVRALTGNNPLKRVVIPRDHPAVGADGHLRDRWGTPYFIHPRSSDSFEIRSAGPDKRLFTADDLVANGARQAGEK